MNRDTLEANSYSEILVVDDSEVNLKLLSDILTNVGYKVKLATSGKLALESIEAKLPSIILLDVMMPEMDGFEVCRRLKADRNTRDIPVIFISALDDEESVLTGFQTGGVDYIPKPIRREEVLARVKTHISLFQMQVDLKVRNEKLENEIILRKQAELAIEKRIVALTMPLEDSMEVDLDELFNIAELQKLQDQFASAFGVGSVITGTDGTPITKPSNFSRLCQNIIRCTDKGLKNCMHSDAVIGRHNQKGPIVMPCLSGGLWDAGASITVGGKHVASWLIGQVRNEVQEENILKEYAVEIGADEEDFMRAFYEVTPMSLKQFRKISEVLFTMAGQLSDMAYQNVQQARFINGKKLAEEALLESEEKFRSFFENSPIGISITTVDGYMQINKSFCGMLGYSETELININCRDITYPADIQKNDDAIASITKGEADSVRFEKRYLHKNGDIIWVDISTSLQRDSDNNPAYFITSINDITERKKAEESLLKFKMGIDNSADAIFITEKNGTIEYINHAFEEIYGYPSSKVIGQTARVLKSGLYSKSYYEHLWDTLLDKKSVSFEIRNKAKDGRIISIEASNNPILDGKGNIIGFISINRDITERKKAEAALIDAEEKMEAFFNQSLDGFFFMMLDEPIEWNGLADVEKLLDYTFSHQRITRINDAMLEQYGATRDQFLGLKPSDRFAHDIQHGKSVWRKLFDYGKLHVETDERKLNGEQIIVEGDYTCLYDSNGCITGHFGIQRDITQNKMSLETVKNERKILRTLIDNLPDLIYVKDKDCRKMVANTADLENIGCLNEAEVLGKTDLELFDSEIGHRGYEDDLIVIQKGEAVINREEVFFDKKGVQRWLLTSKIPLFDQRGKVSGLVGIGRDITQQKKANGTIQKLSKSIEQSPSTIVITDILGNIEYVNPKFTEITGFTPEEVIGKNPRILKSGKMDDEFYKIMWETISSGDVWRGEFLNRKKNGELYWEWATMTSIKNENGMITNYIALKEDISTRKQMEVDLVIAKEKAEENDRLKSSFLANMSHEIRTPLNSIIGFSEILSDPGFDSDERYEFARIITNSGNNLLEIISDIMDISKIEAGQVEVSKSIFSAQKIIRDVQNEYKFRATEKNLDLKIDQVTPEEDFLIESDEAKLRQVLINFVGNALKFTDIGTVEIGVRVIDTSVQFHVKDTGIGISKEFHEHIFERFRQVEGSSTRRYGGNGLGLAISKSLVEMLGGTIGMESESGKGADFYFTLPDVVR
jgi:PAS domain S-box-containing protein